MEEEAIEVTEELLKVMDPIEIVNSYIIPALRYCR